MILIKFHYALNDGIEEIFAANVDVSTHIFFPDNRDF